MRHGHGAGPEASAWIAVAVVHSIIGTVVFDDGRDLGGAGAWVEPDEAVARRDQPVAPCGRRDRADRLADFVDGVVAGGGKERVDLTERDVDEEQALAWRVPDGAFAEVDADV